MLVPFKSPSLFTPARTRLLVVGLLAALLPVLPLRIVAQSTGVAGHPVRVLVWDERQPAQKQAYANFLGNEIADHLRKAGRVTVTSAGLDDPNQGLGSLDQCDVLIWWGHQRQGEIKTETAQDIVKRVQAGRLSLIVLHSAHWSQPFVEAMRERARQDALASLSSAERTTAQILETNLFANFRTPPKFDSMLTPAAQYRKPLDGPIQVKLVLPNCCFPAFRGDGHPSQMRVLLADHPIAHGLAPTFSIEQTEMYDEPFHVPRPDAVVFEERWATGDWFRSGCVWKLNRGRIFYFRPGHETYPVFKNPNVLKVIENAVRWLGTLE